MEFKAVIFKGAVVSPHAGGSRCGVLLNIFRGSAALNQDQLSVECLHVGLVCICHCYKSQFHISMSWTATTQTPHPSSPILNPKPPPKSPKPSTPPPQPPGFISASFQSNHQKGTLTKREGPISLFPVKCFVGLFGAAWEELGRLAGQAAPAYAEAWCQSISRYGDWPLNS